MIDDPAAESRLLAAAREGDAAAFEQLWQHHVLPARRYAARFVAPSDTDDVVSEGFFRVFRAIANGGGPESGFRTYLYTTLRRVHLDQAQGYRRRVRLAADDGELDVETAPSTDDIIEQREEYRTTWQALGSLPDDQRDLLWQLIVAEATPAELSAALGISANGVASRAVRARERLRQAYLQISVRPAQEAACQPTRSRLGQYVRYGMSARGRRAVDSHLATCADCRAALKDAEIVNRTLRGTALPVVVGGLAVAFWRLLDRAGRPGRFAARTVSVKVATLAGVGAGAILIVTLSPSHAHPDHLRAARPVAPVPFVTTSISVAVPTPGNSVGTTGAKPTRVARPSGFVVVTPELTSYSKGPSASQSRPASRSEPPTSTTSPTGPSASRGPSSTAPSEPRSSVATSPTSTPPSVASTPTATDSLTTAVASKATSGGTPTQDTTTVVRSIRMKLVMSGRGWRPGELSASTLTGRIEEINVLGQSGGCTTGSASSASCQVTAGPCPSVSFELKIIGSGSDDVLSIDYRSASGLHFAESVPLG